MIDLGVDSSDEEETATNGVNRKSSPNCSDDSGPDDMSDTKEKEEKARLPSK